MTNMLEVKNIEVAYGKIVAVKDVSLSVNQGEIVTLIGSNGAGKSTTLRTISGLLKPRSGEISFKGERIDGRPGHEIVGLGICHSPEGRRIFPRMTVRENLELGAFLRDDKAAINADMERVLDLFPRLRERIEQRSGTMSGGEQQMLAVSRALMGSPSLLLLDEPSLGLAPLVIEQIFQTIKSLRDQMALTVVLVEQNALGALEIADTGIALNLGKVVVAGSAQSLLNDPAVRAAYLGY
jgi:branched-chain amino acid transport system ATP-binding protein